MNNQVADPLSYNYNYSYNGPDNQDYGYNVKMEPIIEGYTNYNTFPENTTTETEGNNKHAEDKALKSEIKIETDRKRTRGHKSSYFSEKIDRGFPFYACAVCNVNYDVLNDLVTHVDTHKDRLSSYQLKMKKLMNKKKAKKEKRMKKKEKEVKQELDVEIKPEDGYIGNEKASDVNGTDILNQFEEGTGENVLPADKDNVAQSSVTNSNTECTSNVKNKSMANKTSPDATNDNLERIFKCFACSKQFSLGYYLKLHVRSHTDEKPYQCPECGESFITASKLGRHKKRVHLSIKYQCRICFRIFSRWEYLTAHFDKKHADDKLEGEVYDYNEILPYLKELEDQLEKEKKEKEVEEKEKVEQEFIAADTKPKTEDWDWNDINTNIEENRIQVDVKNDLWTEEEPEIVVENVKVELDQEFDADFDDNHFDDQIKDESDGAADDKVKDEESDEDYFPSNTWAVKPDIELKPLDFDVSPSSPVKRKRRSKNDPKSELKCEICQKSISSLTYMKIHLRTHTGERPHKCYICNKGFITSGKMHRHVLTHPEAWIDGDEVKKEGVEIKTEIEGEIKEENETEKKSSKKKLKPKSKLSKIKKESRNYSHICEYCHKRFLHKETLNVHKKSHDAEGLVFKCTYCLEVMPDGDTLKDHEKTHDGPKPFLCTICGKNYKKRESMVWHKKNHKTEKTYVCDICSKSFNAQCKLQRHIVTHRTDKYFLRYECPVCAHMFNTKYHVQMHLATHLKEGLILEENRNEILAMVLQNARKIPRQTDSNSSTLTDLIPADERSRICNICGEVFQHFYYLEEHLKSHGSTIAIEDENKVEERKYVCNVCHKGFKLHYYLKLHSFTHTKEKPYICQQCGKGFITRGKLKRHLETHTGVKKYQCHICYKFFTRPSYLRIHVRTIHGTQDYNFRLPKSFLPTPINSSLHSEYTGYSTDS